MKSLSIVEESLRSSYFAPKEVRDRSSELLQFVLGRQRRKFKYASYFLKSDHLGDVDRIYKLLPQPWRICGIV